MTKHFFGITVQELHGGTGVSPVWTGETPVPLFKVLINWKLTLQKQREMN